MSADPIPNNVVSGPPVPTSPPLVAHEPAAPSIALPVIAAPGLVVFPGTIFPYRVTQPSNLAGLRHSIDEHQWIIVTWQPDDDASTVDPQRLPRIGTLARVLRAIQNDKEGIAILGQAKDRVRLTNFPQTEPFLSAEYEVLLNHLPGDDHFWSAALANLRETAVKLIELSPEIPDEAANAVRAIEDPVALTDMLAANLNVDAAVKQALLEETDVRKRLEIVQKKLNDQLHIAELQAKLREEMKTEFSETQKKAYLREQMRSIQRELGEDDGEEEQVDELRQRLEAANLPVKAKEAAQRELKRLKFVPAASPEHSVIVNYLETLAELPWNKVSEESIDLAKARQILDEDHFGLEKIKRRLIEYLAVRKLKPDGRGPILCFAGPPGVGKTSLGKSIAKALGREFVRISLGGMRDEAEIRGHRRTYIGSMPGRVIQELRRAGTRNPVILLDEIDKLGADFRGDPASALLEVLDPHQNHDFVDRYLDVPFDLSRVVFIATANYLDDIPEPLFDRLEVIRLAGYTEAEKHAIATRYLVPRQLEEHGLTETQCRWTGDALELLIEHYTREAGVRQLEREIGTVTRAVATDVVENPERQVEVTSIVVAEKLGPFRFVRDAKVAKSEAGIVNGLAYTQHGGDVMHIEALAYPGEGRVKLTGQLGDVMRESVDAAYSLVKSRAVELGIPASDFHEQDFHIHVPAGAVPKDGPSAGVAMFIALASLLTDRRVNKEVAMTGEITLRGLVLPIGGLKEKTIAALRAGIRRVLIPKQNEKDLPELPAEVRERLEILPVSTVDEALELALEEATPPSGGRHD